MVNKKEENADTLPSVFTTEDAIQGYFQSISQSLTPFEIYQGSEHQIDFLKLRRFLVTTYNNLVDLDLEIKTDEIVQLSKNLQKLSSLYDNFKQRALHVKKAFDELFLSQNDEFVHVQKVFDENKEMIQFYDRQIQLMENTLKKLELLKQKVPETSLHYPVVIEKIKNARAKSVDSVHYKRSLEEENFHLAQYMYMIINENEESFKTKFSVQASQFDQRILKLLNKLAYTFDVALWKEAKRSKAITKYFEKLQMKGTISSLTYLRYYIQSLDMEKSTEETRALAQLIPYLESLEQRTIFYLSDDIDRSLRVRKILTSLNKKIDFSIVTEIKSAYQKIQNTLPNYIFVDFSSDFRGLIKVLKKLGVEREIVLIVLIDQNEDISDDRYKQIYIDHIIGTRVSEKELSEKLKRIIE